MFIWWWILVNSSSWLLALVLLHLQIVSCATDSLVRLVRIAGRTFYPGDVIHLYRQQTGGIQLVGLDAALYPRFSFQSSCTAMAFSEADVATPIILVKSKDIGNVPVAVGDIGSSQVAVPTTQDLAICLSRDLKGVNFSTFAGYTVAIVEVTAVDDGARQLQVKYGSISSHRLLGVSLPPTMQLFFQADCRLSPTTLPITVTAEGRGAVTFEIGPPTTWNRPGTTHNDLCLCLDLSPSSPGPLIDCGIQLRILTGLYQFSEVVRNGAQVLPFDEGPLVAALHLPPASFAMGTTFVLLQLPLQDAQFPLPPLVVPQTQFLFWMQGEDGPNLAHSVALEVQLTLPGQSSELWVQTLDVAHVVASLPSREAYAENCSWHLAPATCTVAPVADWAPWLEKSVVWQTCHTGRFLVLSHKPPEARTSSNPLQLALCVVLPIAVILGCVGGACIARRVQCRSIQIVPQEAMLPNTRDEGPQGTVAEYEDMAQPPSHTTAPSVIPTANSSVLPCALPLLHTGSPETCEPLTDTQAPRDDTENPLRLPFMPRPPRRNSLSHSQSPRLKKAPPVSPMPRKDSPVPDEQMQTLPSTVGTSNQNPNPLTKVCSVRIPPAPRRHSSSLNPKPSPATDTACAQSSTHPASLLVFSDILDKAPYFQSLYNIPFVCAESFTTQSPAQDASFHSAVPSSQLDAQAPTSSDPHSQSNTPPTKETQEAMPDTEDCFSPCAEDCAHDVSKGKGRPSPISPRAMSLRRRGVLMSKSSMSSSPRRHSSRSGFMSSAGQSSMQCLGNEEMVSDGVSAAGEYGTQSMARMLLAMVNGEDNLLPPSDMQVEDSQNSGSHSSWRFRQAELQFLNSRPHVVTEVTEVEESPSPNMRKRRHEVFFYCPEGS